MRRRYLFSTVWIGFAALCLVPSPVACQTPGAASKKSVSSSTNGKPWSGLTPDEKPDLQGTWTNQTLTPFERPKELGTKQFLTEEEAAALEKRASQRDADRPPRDGDVGAYNDVWLEPGTKVASTRQTSLVMDPPDGRVPVLPQAEAKRVYSLDHIADSYEYMSPWDRCITRGMPAAMFPAGYNNAYRILQVPGYVIIASEMIHETRIIPTDGRKHLPGEVRQWNGDPVGRWDGNTLVVDTTNFNGKGWISTSAAGGRIRGLGESTALHLVERFTRVDKDTIHYDVTIDDPNTVSKSWRVSIPLSRDDQYQMYEYACHEGNHAVENTLRGGRAMEKAAGEGK